MTSADRTPVWISALVWVHAACFAALGIGCHLTPQAIFGQSSWIPMARLVAGLLAAALLAFAFFMIFALRSGSARNVRWALLTGLVFDVQVPFLLALHPASFEFLDRDVGVPWMLVPLAVIFGLVVPGIVALSALKSLDAQQPN